MSNNSNSSNGIGLGTLLCIVFMVLKLCGIITWSWWWVFAPVWIPILIVIICAILVATLK